VFQSFSSVYIVAKIRAETKSFIENMEIAFSQSGLLYSDV
jgi:hypothetical protein